MKKKFFLFAYTFFLTMTLPILFPSLNLFFFAPFIVMTFYHRSLNQSLGWAFICGILMDLFSSQTSLGIYAFNYCLVTLCLHRYQSHLFEERLSTLPVLTFCFICLSNLLHTIVLYLIGKSFYLSGEWFQTGFFSIPFQSIIYTFAAFTLPMWFISYAKRHSFLFRFSKRRKT